MVPNIPLAKKELGADLPVREYLCHEIRDRLCPRAKFDLAVASRPGRFRELRKKGFLEPIGEWVLASPQVLKQAMSSSPSRDLIR